MMFARLYLVHAAICTGLFSLLINAENNYLIYLRDALHHKQNEFNNHCARDSSLRGLLYAGAYRRMVLDRMRFAPRVPAH
jgi:hypothetical protein